MEEDSMMDLYNKPVTMTKRFARWNINHLDGYDSPSTSLEDIEDVDLEIQLFLMCLLGHPVKGLIKGEGIDCYLVWFHEAGVSMWTYAERGRDFTLG